MSHKRHVWETVSDFLVQQGGPLGDGLAALEKQLGKLGREQYKANTLAEAQAERTATLETLQDALSRQESARDEAVRKARLDILEALLPVLDGLEAGLKSGGRHAYRLHQQGSPEAGTLIAWLDGQRLLRDRLLALLEAEGIQPIPPSVSHSTPIAMWPWAPRGNNRCPKARSSPWNSGATRLATRCCAMPGSSW